MQTPSLAYTKKKVAVLNRLSELAKTHHEGVADIFRPFIGCKIILADGRYIKPIRDQIHSFDAQWENALPGARKIGWRNRIEGSRYTIFDHSRLDLIDAAYDGSREAVTIDSYLASLDGPNLEELKDWEDRPVYDAAQTMADLERLAKLRKELDELESHCWLILRR